MTKELCFKPGASSVFKQTSDLFPVLPSADVDISHLSIDKIQTLAFDDSSSHNELVALGSETVKNLPPVSLNLFKQNLLAQYKNIRIGFLGTG